MSKYHTFEIETPYFYVTDDSMTVELLKVSCVHICAVRKECQKISVILSSVIASSSASFWR